MRSELGRDDLSIGRLGNGTHGNVDAVQCSAV